MPQPPWPCRPTCGGSPFESVCSRCRELCKWHSRRANGTAGGHSSRGWGSSYGCHISTHLDVQRLAGSLNPPISPAASACKSARVVSVRPRLFVTAVTRDGAAAAPLQRDDQSCLIYQRAISLVARVAPPAGRTAGPARQSSPWPALAPGARAKPWRAARRRRRGRSRRTRVTAGHRGCSAAATPPLRQTYGSAR